MSSKSRWIILRLLVVAIAALPSAGCSKKAETEPAEVPKVVQKLPLLLSVSDLQTRLKDGNIRVVDARPSKSYLAAHIPGAAHVTVNDWKNKALADGGLHDSQAWAANVGNLGIGALTHVVVYADHPANATRIWWTLRYLGVENVAILDGGWKLWQKEKGETSSEVPKIKPVKFSPDFQSDRLAEIGELKKSYASEDLALIDTRSEGEYTTGRIPGAVRLEWKDLMTEDNRFKSIEELRKIFSASGLVHEKTAITYCQTGGRASLDAFALELAGFPKVKNYYCSWGQWSKDGEAPVEK